VVILLAILGTVGGIALSRILKPTYTASATLWVQGSDKDLGQQNHGPIRADQLLQSAGWVDLLKSFVVLDEVVKQQRLYVVPARAADSAAFDVFAAADQLLPGNYKLTVDASGRRFTLSTKAGQLVEEGQVGDSVGNKIGFQWVPPATLLRPGASIAFAVSIPRDAAQRLSKALQVRMDQNGNFMSVSYSGPSARRAADVVNAVVDREVAVATDLKKAKLAELTKILEDQLQLAQTNLTTAENQLETFRVHTVTLPSDQATPVVPGLAITQNPVMNSFFAMKIDREQLRRDKAAIMAVLDQVPDSGISVDALEVIPSVHNSVELHGALGELASAQANLRALRYKYTDATPVVAAAAAQVDTLQRQTVPRLARNLIADITQREQALDTQVSSASTDLQQIPARTIEEGRLQRAVVIAENLYSNLRARYEEAHLEEESSVPDVRILDAAVAPEKPSSNTGPKMLLLGLIAGLGLGVGAAVVLNRFDPRVRYPEHVTTELGLPILGALTRVSAANGNGRPEEMAQVVEALRSIRLNLVHAHGAAGTLLVTISSPGSGDGKSFLASNLAIAFADAGFQTLLIDGDLRRGGLHRVLSAQRKPGLTDYLTGTIGREQVIQGTPYPMLSFIGGGTRKQTAPELLGTPAMRDLVLGMRGSYNVILIDSPPLGAAVDPFMLATLTGNLVVVLRTGATDRQMARAKLEMLDRLPVRILGAVLNDVQAEGVYRYYGYLAGYEAEEERKAGKELKQIATTAGQRS